MSHILELLCRDKIILLESTGDQIACYLGSNVYCTFTVAITEDDTPMEEQEAENHNHKNRRGQVYLSQARPR